MTTYSVLTEEYRELPHLEWGKDLAHLMGSQVQDVYLKLRRQQGIVWSGLERDRADTLGGYMIQKGYPAGLVEDANVATLGNPELIRNADPVDEGLELEDIWGKKTLLESGTMVLVQAGWVKEKIAVGSSTDSTPRFDKTSKGSGPAPYKRKPPMAKIGWVMQIFQKGDPCDITRIMGSYFNYDYQNVDSYSRDQRFGMLLKDLSNSLPYEILDKGYRISMGSTSSAPSEAIFDTLDELNERARWQLTLRQVKG